MQTDRIFFEALKADADIVALCTDGDEAVRIYNPAVPMPDEELDNVKLPYIVVAFNGMTNGEGTKDSLYEGNEDDVNIGITVVAKNRDLLADLVEKVRAAIPAYFKNYEAPEAGDGDEDETEVEDLSALIPIDYKLSAGAVSYDPDRPCVFIELNYACLTNK